MKRKIEYRQVEGRLYLSEQELNAMGAEGWELRGILDSRVDPDHWEPVRYVFARPVAEPVAEVGQ